MAGGGGRRGRGICEKHYFLRNLFVLVMYSLSNIKSDSLCSLNISSFKLRKISALITCAPVR